MAPAQGLRSVSTPQPAPCPLCGETRFRVLAVKFGLSILRCRRCGFGLAFPPPGEAEVRARYQSSGYMAEAKAALHAGDERYDPDFARRHYHLALSVLEREAGNCAKTLLDVGCGLGFFLKAAESTGWTAEGVDVSEPSADFARRVVGVRVRSGTLEDARFASGSFDAVTMLDTIEHLDNPLYTLRESCRVLKPGGILLIQTPDLDSLSRRILGRSWAVLSPWEHLAYFSARSLGLALRRAGFEAAAVRNLLVFDPAYTHRRSGLAYRSWKNGLARWEKLRTAGNIHGFEGLALRAEANPGLDALAGLSRGQILERRLFLGLKPWLKGDVLFAVGRKPRA